MPTEAEIEAAYKAILPRLHTLVSQYVPSFFQGRILQTLDSPSGRQEVEYDIQTVLIAAEKARGDKK